MVGNDSILMMNKWMAQTTSHLSFCRLKSSIEKSQVSQCQSQRKWSRFTVFDKMKSCSPKEQNLLGFLLTRNSVLWKINSADTIMPWKCSDVYCAEEGRNKLRLAWSKFIYSMDHAIFSFIAFHDDDTINTRTGWWNLVPRETTAITLAPGFLWVFSLDSLTAISTAKTLNWTYSLVWNKLQWWLRKPL